MTSKNRLRRNTEPPSNKHPAPPWPGLLEAGSAGGDSPRLSARLGHSTGRPHGVIAGASRPSFRQVGAGVEPTAALPIMMVPRGYRAIARAWVLETGGQRWLSM